MEEYKRRIDSAHTVTGVPTYWEELQQVKEERDSLLAMLEESTENYKELLSKFRELTERFTELQTRVEQLYKQSEYWQNIASH